MNLVKDLSTNKISFTDLTQTQIDDQKKRADEQKAKDDKELEKKQKRANILARLEKSKNQDILDLLNLLKSIGLILE